MRRRIQIANARSGGLWWKVPVALAIWLTFAAPVVAVITCVVVLRGYAEDLPDEPDLEAWEDTLPRSSVIVAADGTVVAEIPFTDGDEVGHRFPVAYRDIPERMVQAVLAAEDVRFFEHDGVDLQAVARAAWANYRAGHIVEGASTLTQQVARNLLPEQIGHERTLRRKVREALLARRIERRYPKQRIFETYVNHAFLGAGAYGITAAARAYFSKSLDDLDLAETALIAGLAQAPGRADPYKDEEAARARRDEVLARMAAAGFVTAAEAEDAAAEPIALRPPPLLYGTVAPWHTERARQAIEEAMPRAYARGGLRIETAALPALSFEAEERARAWTEKLGRGREHGAPQAGALIWDHTTGYVEATVGGTSWEASKFDRAAQACRQPGSAFKPIVYAAALEAGAITPGTPLRDAPIAEWDEETGIHWKPTNSGRRFRGVALAHDALASSLNAPAVDVLDRVGTDRVIALAGRLGIDTELDDVRPMALGASCVIPLQLAGAFATFAGGGARVDPVFVVRVTRGARTLLERASPRDPWIAPRRRLDLLAARLADSGDDHVLDPRDAFLISTMLRDVVRRGTATDARDLGRPAAGKTGTTNDNTDAWFVGYTGRVLAAVWVGHDDPAQTLGPRHGGAQAALPLWEQLVRAAEGERRPVEVPGEPPPGLERARIDRETGYLAAPGAGGGLDLYFKRGTAPTRRADAVHGVPTDLGRMSREF